MNFLIQITVPFIGEGFQSEWIKVSQSPLYTALHLFCLISVCAARILRDIRDTKSEIVGNHKGTFPDLEKKKLKLHILIRPNKHLQIQLIIHKIIYNINSDFQHYLICIPHHFAVCCSIDCILSFYY